MSPEPGTTPHVQPGVRTDRMVSCCLESVLSGDGRGQLVIPEGIRTRAYSADDDTPALIGGEQGGATCCLSLCQVRSCFSGCISDTAPADTLKVLQHLR